MDHILDAQAHYDELPEMEGETQFELALLLLEDLTLNPAVEGRLRDLLEGCIEERRKLGKLIDHIEQVVPYVTATLGPGNRLTVEGHTEWTGIHKGRCFSSHRQLEQLVGEARKMKHWLRTGEDGPVEAPSSPENGS
jgi:hypothetical protein